MSESSRFSQGTEHRADELWNVSLFPISSTSEGELTLRGLENADERRSRLTIVRPLRVILESSGGILG